MHRRCPSRVRSEVHTGVVVAATLIGSCTSPTDTPEALRLEALTATSLAGTVGEYVTPAPVVRVTNAAGRPMAGIAVSFNVVGAGGITNGGITNASAQTDAGGSAAVGRWVLGPVAGAHTVTARAGDTEQVVFTAIAKPGPVARMTYVSGNLQAALVGVTLSSPLRVSVADRFGNRVSPVPVSFAVISGGGSIAGSTAITASDGIATSGAWTLGPTLGAQQVRAQAEGAQAVFTAYACDESCPEGQLLFVRDGRRIFSTTLPGNDARQLTSDLSTAFDPAWSADGRRIAFVRLDFNDAFDLYLMDADGSNVVRRAAGFGSPAWSPDGRRLAVSQEGDCCEMFLLSVDEDGTPPVHVASQAAYPAWSPDGKRIAFVSLSGGAGYHALQVMNADGSGVESITLRDEGRIWRPTWSPDGRRIAFSKCRGGCNIFIVNLDGTGLVQLTTVGNAEGPAWSPDGTRIAFTLRSSSGDGLVAYVAVNSGGDPIVIVSPGESPAWRPPLRR